MAAEGVADDEPGETPRRLRVFISSPGDVRPERSIAARLIARLGREFSSFFQLEAVLWEREPLVATAHFQDSITPPRETDIVVVVLWSRLGVPLPLATYPGAVTGRQVTGTEWEFEDAVAASRRQGLPDLLFYRKRAALAGSDDTAQLVEQLRQKQLVDEFIQRWFVDAGANNFKAAFREFHSSAEFEDMLETHLRELLTQRLDGGGRHAASAIRWHAGSPFRALESFELAHAQVFFGRTRDRNELRETLARRISAGCALVAVFGASGSGKSSLVKAGLLADLQLPGMVGRVALCRYAVFKPTDSPEDLLLGLARALLTPAALPELAGLRYDAARLRALLHSAPAQAVVPLESALALASQAAQLTPEAQARLVLVVDQLEELFTLERLEAQARQDFVLALDSLARCGLVWVVATMRSDFFDRLHELPLLAQLTAGEGRYLLLPPGPAELQHIIRRPAAEAGLSYELDAQQGLRLDELLLAEAQAAPAALPLLEFTLDQLWQQRSPQGLLMLEAYRRMGGLLGALGCRADAVYAQRSAAEQAALPAVLRALAHVLPSGLEQVAARVVPLARFAPGSAARKLVEAMLAPDARLLVAGEGGQVRVAHEALFSHWPRGRDALSEARADLQTRSRLELAQALWAAAAASDKTSRLLPRGKPLAEAKDLLDRRREEMDAPIAAYIEASNSAATAVERRERARLRAAAAVFALLAAGAGVAAWVAVKEKRVAEQQARDAGSRELAEVAHSLVASDPELAVLIALRALDSSPTAQAERALRVALQPTPRLSLPGHGARVTQLAFGDGGRWLATAAADGRVRLWDTNSGVLLRTLAGVGSGVAGLAAKQDGPMLASVHGDGRLSLRPSLDAAPHALADPPPPDSPLSAVALTRTGTWLAAGDRNGQLVMWAADSGRRQARVDVGAAVNRLAFSSDGTRLLAATDREAVLCSVPDGQVLLRLPHPAPVLDVALSHDGQLLASAAGETVRLWKTSGGAARELSQRDGFVTSVVFADDDRFVIAGGQSGRLRWWSTRTGAWVHERAGPRSAVRSMAMSPDGRWVAAGGDDDRVRVWDAPGPVPEGRLSSGDGEVANAAFGANGRQAVTAHDNGMVRLWDTATGQLLREFKADPAGAVTALFSPDGRRVVSGGAGRGAQSWDAASGQPLRAFPPAGRQINSVAFSVQGTWLATAGVDGIVRVFGADGNEPPRELADDGSELLVTAFSPDGRRLASGGTQGQVLLWDLDSGTVARRLPAQAQVYAVAFHPQAPVLASTGADGSVRLWNVDSGAALAKLDAPRLGRVVSLDFSRDGQFLLAAHEDGVVQVWDVQGVTVVMEFPGIEGVRTRSAAFGTDATALIVAGSDGIARLYRCGACLSLPALRDAAALRVNRKLTEEEQKMYFHRLPAANGAGAASTPALPRGRP